MSESTLQRAVMDYLTMIEARCKLYWFRSASGAVQTASGRFFKTGKPGVPDISVIFNGQFIGLEIKTATGRQSSAQKEAQAEIERSGGKYYIVRSLQDVKAIFG